MLNWYAHSCSVARAILSRIGASEAAGRRTAQNGNTVGAREVSMRIPTIDVSTVYGILQKSNTLSLILKFTLFTTVEL